MRTDARSLLAAGVVGLAVGPHFTGSIAPVLPLLLVLACPLMMILVMKGRSGGHGGMHHPPEDRDRDATGDRRS
jgi:hypothetical protein